MKELHSDILIIGGGLTGLMTAYALSPLKKNIIIIDKFDFGVTQNATVDLRTTAIAEGSKIFFEKINIWPQLSKYTEPIKYIKVVDWTENRKINFYNKKLITFTPNRIFYAPSTYLSASLTSISNDFYKITYSIPELLWKTNSKDKLKFENLHSFLWLTRLDRKNSKRY